MVRSALSKAAWVGRTASMVFGLALVMALVLGVASMAFGANGQKFILGKLNNAATKVTGLVGNVDGAAALRVTNPNAGTNDTALDLRVQAGEAPMEVNSATRVANLNAATAGRADSAASADNATNAQNATNAANADTLDNKDSTEIGVNGLQRVLRTSANDSVSPKFAPVASCPSGKVVVGTGFDIDGGKTGGSPDELANVVVDQVLPADNFVRVVAFEVEPTNLDWSVTAIAICATGP